MPAPDGKSSFPPTTARSPPTGGRDGLTGDWRSRDEHATMLRLVLRAASHGGGIVRIIRPLAAAFSAVIIASLGSTGSTGPVAPAAGD